MNPLLVVLPFHNGDLDASIKLLRWINELNQQFINMPRSILLAADSAVPIEKCKEVKALAQMTFAYVETTTVRVTAKDWRAPNEMFHHISGLVKSNYKFPFLWMEPDCTPLVPNWLCDLAESYAQCPRPFMGAFVNSTQEGLPPVHMTGCAIYPQNAIDYLSRYCDTKAEFAWDIASAKDIVVGCKAQDTKLIQSLYGEKELAPSFVLQKVQGQEYAANVMDIGYLNERAVMFHRCKDGTLIDVLRAMRNENMEKDPHFGCDPVESKNEVKLTRSEQMKKSWEVRRANKQMEQPKANT